MEETEAAAQEVLAVMALSPQEEPAPQLLFTAMPLKTVSSVGSQVLDVITTQLQIGCR